jgi:hypothetical protein
LRNEANPYVTSLVMQGMENITVSHFLHNLHHTWQWDVIGGVLNNRDMEEIAKIATNHMGVMTYVYVNLITKVIIRLSRLIGTRWIR